MAIVKRRVYVQAADGRLFAWLRPGDTVPDWATVTNPRVLADEPKTEPTPAPAPTPAPKKAPAKAAPKPPAGTADSE